MFKVLRYTFDSMFKWWQCEPEKSVRITEGGIWRLGKTVRPLVQVWLKWIQVRRKYERKAGGSSWICSLLAPKKEKYFNFLLIKAIYSYTKDDGSTSCFFDLCDPPTRVTLATHVSYVLLPVERGHLEFSVIIYSQLNKYTEGSYQAA